MSEKPEKTINNNLLQYLLVFIFGIGLSGLILFLNHRPTPQMIQILPTGTNSPLVIQITGEVLYPGMYNLGQNARVGDLVDLAGGFTANADENAVNLAKIVYDGQQVNVPSLNSDNETAVNPHDTSDSTSSTLININHCSIEDLMTLPGIGETKASAIIKYREENGVFEVKEDIIKVSGIGDSIFNSIEELITVK